jgi:DNA-binding NtrC family response regulator
MGSAYPLAGSWILVVEDEPLISLDMAATFESAGANVLSARTVAEAVGQIGQDDLSGAVLIPGWAPRCVGALRRLRARGIPFMFYTGNGAVRSYPGTVVVQKPATRDLL